LMWTVSPILLLFFMAYPSLQLLYLTEDSIDCSVVVKAIGHQWYWEYQYNSLDLHFSFDSYMMNSANLENNFALYRNLDVDNRIVLPVNIRSLVLVTSADVLHSWTIPRLGVKADAIPGRLNQVALAPLYSGVYYGQCSELCGSNHSFIPITLEAVSGEDFISWLKVQVNS
jgi:cytochrome c oxidase subunit 2